MDYAGSFRILGREAGFEPHYIGGLEKAARFRNRLIYLHREVDDDELYRILTENPGNLDQFAVAAGRVVA